MNIMSATSATETAPQPGRIVTHWRRFSSGLWRLPEGDINAAYSGSTFPKIRVFVHEGRRFTNCGASFFSWIKVEVHAYPLIPVGQYQGADSVPYSYEGREAAYKGNVFRLGAQVVFASSEPTVVEWRRLLRSFFGHGSPLVSGGDYRKFLTGRCAPDSENGRAASLMEIADCENGVLPRTKDAMREWLEAGAKASSKPVQQLDFTL